MIVLIVFVSDAERRIPIQYSKRVVGRKVYGGQSTHLPMKVNMDDIGVDACRFFFNAKPDSHLEFDLDLAIRQDSENPVYYVQYAHARICTLIAALADEGVKMPETFDATLLQDEQEKALVKVLASFTEEIRQAALTYDPSRINRYVIDVAAHFHRFYAACRIKDAEPALRDARLALCDCTKTVIENALEIIGVSAPEKM